MIKKYSEYKVNESDDSDDSNIDREYQEAYDYFKPIINWAKKAREHRNLKGANAPIVWFNMNVNIPYEFRGITLDNVDFIHKRELVDFYKRHRNKITLPKISHDDFIDLFAPLDDRLSTLTTHKVLIYNNFSINYQLEVFPIPEERYEYMDDLFSGDINLNDLAIIEDEVKRASKYLGLEYKSLIRVDEDGLPVIEIKFS